MQLVDTRRLTGKSLLGEVPLVLVELALDEHESLEAVTRTYLEELARMREALGLPGQVALVSRPHRGGAVLAYPERIDTLLADAEISEWAAESAAARLGGHEPLPLEPKLAEISAMRVAQASPNLVALEAACLARGLPFLWDDELVSVGEGTTCLTFPRADVPVPADIALGTARAVPTAMVTGTNGKTTSSRLLAWMARAEGHVVGLTSSDGALVDDDVLASGDFTGPAAARLVLRDRRVTFAVLETARGGILRRGLARSRCDVALLTNVSADHLGGYGVDDLADMTAVKAVVARAAEKAVVLNAADPSLLTLATSLKSEVVFFADCDARPETRAAIDAHRADGGAVTFTRAGEIVHARGAHETSIFAADRAPITYGGSARYNVENALGATAAALAAGLSVGAVSRALATFGPTENPGRGEVLEKDGVFVVLDFAHNAEGARALRALVDSLRARNQGRLTVIAGSPGDRSDDDIRGLARAVLDMRPDHVVVRELSHYLRGRSLGEIPELFRSVVEPAGVPFAEVASEVAGIDRALESARPGDVIALLAHVDRDDVRTRLRA